MKFLKIYIRIVAIAAFISVILQYGFTIPNRFTLYILGLNMFIALSFAFNAIVRLVVSPNKLRTIRSNILEYILLFLIILQLLVWHGFWEKLSPYFQNLNIFSLTNLYIITLQLYILATLILKLPSVNAILSGLRIPPPLIVIGSFSFVILLGTLLLLLPKATYMRISFIDALFTATSAVCVTGLVVLDIGRQFTTFGQFIILLLIQVGGLGIMTITSFFALILRGELGIKERRVLGDILNFRTFSQLKTLVNSIFWTTIVIEIIGALLMYTRFTKYQGINDASPLWNAIFHSVSAFCNAGFSLFPRNFAHFVKDKELSFIAMALIVLGGIGFVVIRDILSAVSALLRRRSQVVRLMLQTRIVLKMTLFLIVVGAFVFLIIENNNLLAGLTLTEKLVASLFQSVTARTCGFNTVDIGLISLPAMMLLILLMFIGASPGGTGGGIKTTTAAILAGLIRAR
ncbi:MAG: TrkH family potassium uptake protein, partial [bacterium]